LSGERGPTSLIYPTAKAVYFFAAIWTGQVTLIWFNNSRYARKRFARRPANQYLAESNFRYNDRIGPDCGDVDRGASVTLRSTTNEKRK
jgi:hypothetical protein